MNEKRDDVITVTVSAPAGKRALVSHYGEDGKTQWIVPGGTSQEWRVHSKSSIHVSEGEPHRTVAHGADPA